MIRVRSYTYWLEVILASLKSCRPQLFNHIEIRYNADSESVHFHLSFKHVIFRLNIYRTLTFSHPVYQSFFKRSKSCTETMKYNKKSKYRGIRPEKRLGFQKKVRILDQKMVVSGAIFGRLRPGFHRSTSFAESYRSAVFSSSGDL